LEEVIAENPERKAISVFEVAHVYHPQPQDLPQQELYVTLVSSAEYREVRGVLETLATYLFIDGLDIVQDQPTQGILKASVGRETVTLGTVRVLANGHTVIEIKMSELLKVVQTHPEYHPLPKTAIIREDLTFTIPENQQIGPILDQVKTLSPLIRDVQLSAVYKRNFTFSLEYHDTEQNITAEQVEPVRKKVVTAIQEKHQAKLVGSV
jgi:phenylalanyl-tRNA synthetase beta subunit